MGKFNSFVYSKWFLFTSSIESIKQYCFISILLLPVRRKWNTLETHVVDIDKWVGYFVIQMVMFVSLIRFV